MLPSDIQRLKPFDRNQSGAVVPVTEPPTPLPSGGDATNFAGSDHDPALSSEGPSRSTRTSSSDWLLPVGIGGLNVSFGRELTATSRMEGVRRTFGRDWLGTRKSRFIRSAAPE